MMLNKKHRLPSRIEKLIKCNNMNRKMDPVRLRRLQLLSSINETIYSPKETAWSYVFQRQTII